MEQSQRQRITLATVPLDVKICLLKSVPNKATLVALRLACKDYNRAYKVAEDDILTDVMTSDLHDKGFKAKDVLQLEWKVRDQILDHYKKAIRALYEL